MERIGIYISKEDALKEIKNKFFSNNTIITIKENVIYCRTKDKVYFYFFDESFELEKEYFDYFFIRKDIKNSFYNKLLEFFIVKKRDAKQHLSFSALKIAAYISC